MLPSPVYNFIKYFALTAIPALTLFWNTMAPVWAWPYTNEISASISAVGLLLFGIIGGSKAAYNKKLADDAASEKMPKAKKG